MGPIGFLCGLPFEGRILARALGPKAPIAWSAGDPARVEAALVALEAKGARAFVSIGLAGGLDPALEPGALVIPEIVLDGAGGRWQVDADLHGKLLTTKPDSTDPAYGSEQALATVEAKMTIHARTGAAIVDMESHRLAASGRPFAVLRVVADPAARALPAVALAALNRQGEVDPFSWAVARAVLERPGDVRNLLGLARDAATARRCLSRVGLGLRELLGLM